MKKSITVILFSLGLSVALHAQSLRIQSLGGMTLGLRDPYSSLNLYDFGRNPAWLSRDEFHNWIEITPAMNDSWGGYKKTYDPHTLLNYQIGVQGVQVLGDNGTFRGTASYGYEQHKEVYRALKRLPYQGDAFFMTDTTTGDITFKGPLVQFMYSYELFADLFIGAAGSYQLLDGLKDRYSRTKTIYRNLNASIGIAYQASPELSVGGIFTPGSSQEGIEAKSDELYDVEIFNFRGETFAFRQRGSSIDHKVRINGESSALHAIWHAEESLTIGMRGDYGVDLTHVLVTRGSEKEIEEGTASLEHYSAELRAQYLPDTNLTVGLSVEYSRNREWSKYTTLNLLLWDWRIGQFNIGLGASYAIVPEKLLCGAEYEFVKSRVDSSKYIDNRFFTEKPTSHVVRAGIEYKIMDGAFVRMGYIGRFSSFDVASGARDVAFHGITGGGAILLNQDVQIEVFTEYGKASPKNLLQSRSMLNAGVAVRLWSR